jgi:DNA polymerase/3'-5' exonuclease PolX
LALPEGINLDLFIVTPPAQWGVIFTIRTGPADFSHWLVTQRRKGGCMPSYATQRDGCVYVNGKPLAMAEEMDYLNFLGLGWIEPQDRKPQWGHAPVLAVADLPKIASVTPL